MGSSFFKNDVTHTRTATDFEVDYWEWDPSTKCRHCSYVLAQHVDNQCLFAPTHFDAEPGSVLRRVHLKKRPFAQGVSSGTRRVYSTKDSSATTSTSTLTFYVTP